MKNSKRQLVSVIIPTYDRENVLPRAINSVIKQKYTNWELIIVDDRSTDNTKELIKKYMEKDKRIKYVVNKHKKGPGGARNQGLELAKGKYIAFLDSDDEWFDNHLEECVEVLETKPVDFCAASWHECRNGKMEENGCLDLLRHSMTTLTDGNEFIDGIKICELALINFGAMASPVGTFVFRSIMLDKTGTFNENLLSAQDTEFIFRLLQHSHYYYSDNIHLIIHEGNDNVYNFNDKENVLKVKHCSKNAIKCGNIIKGSIRKTSRFKQPKMCIKKVNQFISDKNWQIGIAYKKKK